MIDDKIRLEIEAAAFRKLIEHLQAHPEIQNIELMITADFCRNCLAKWLISEAQTRGVPLDYEEARETVYGMPYSEWKARHQTPATPEQLKAYEERQQNKSKQTQQR